MTDLATQLERLGLEQYLDVFEEEGFDSWEILLDIQESDLEALGVKLGHRRKLQRAIADFRGISYDRLLGSPGQESSADAARHGEGSSAVPLSSTAAPAPETKRRYRRHPKADDNAPEKPPSAYVLFSNRVREEVKDDHLSFTEIAKLVGEKWQKLDHTQKAPFESRATAMKEQYNIQMSAYKKTEAYREYAQYLADFRAKHHHEHKRPRLDAQSSGGSVSATSVDPSEMAPPASLPPGGESTGAVSAGSFSGPLGTLGGTLVGTTTASLPTLSAGLGPGPGLGPGTGVARSSSPTWSHLGRDRRPPLLQSTPSSISDDSLSVRTDTQEALSRAATLSLHTPPTVTPPLPSRTSTTLPPHTHAVLTTDHLRDRSSDLSRPATSQTMPLAMSLPSLLASDRLPDVTRSHAQRTLPPLLPPPASAQPPLGFTSGLLHMVPPPQVTDATTGQAPYHLSPGGPGINNQDSDAANTLAELARRPDEESHQPLPRRRPR